ncbi:MULTISPECIES: hypothetical protein [Burkholderia]|uniref:Uncharacterized protein n=1 Tax=Burkholderia mayonis TaxID=1385591 RepID=A0A1B4FJJ1_9BURK|nr:MULTISPECIES: hypothetical protein [Burkholderia]AOJ03788.1 hypothetical protein WS70_17850 [Burkholderia mayonis]KVE42513.1 hypothetical protein WS70_11915 [Burkholderia mayonis]KVE42679.1 hypothetical protein WS69_25185 [Burkholderia sp. BDU5]
MPYVTLELLTEDADRYSLPDLIGVDSASPDMPHVCEMLLADAQWPTIQAYLDRQELPYKFARPSTARRVPRNNPRW